MTALNALERLLKIASESLSSASAPADLRGRWALYRAKNGLFAFASALLVLPWQRSGDIPGVEYWNRRDGWRRHYAELDPEITFFALDAFAGQFGQTGNGIVRLDPESGEIEEHSRDLEDWADKLLENYDYETGWSVADEWQKTNGPLSPGHRLLPRTPFILGGDYAADQMVSVPCEGAAEMLGILYEQVRSVPDGEELTITNWLPAESRRIDA